MTHPIDTHASALGTRLFAAIPALLLSLGCICGGQCSPCGSPTESACIQGEAAYWECNPGDGWWPWNYWTKDECADGEACLDIDDYATCGAPPVTECRKYGAKRCVDGKLQECSGLLGGDAPMVWKLREDPCP